MFQRNGNRAFTLIELLVVVSVIALLIGLLLPALSHARDRAHAGVCLSNQRQLTLAFFNYAYDNEVIPGVTLHGSKDLDWAGSRNNKYNQNKDQYDHPLEASVLYPYLSQRDEVTECPAARRRANLLFDYTMLARAGGARTDVPWRMLYPVDPAKSTGDYEYFQAIPLLIEEDYEWHNRRVPDGTWAWYDQFSDRHDSTGNIAYLDGSAGRFSVKNISTPKRQDKTNDLTAIKLRLEVQEIWYYVHDVYTNTPNSWNGFGWMNKPRGPGIVRP